MRFVSNETCVFYKKKTIIARFIKGRGEKNNSSAHAPGGVQLSILLQLDEDQEASLKGGIRSPFHHGAGICCKIALIWWTATALF